MNTAMTLTDFINEAKSIMAQKELAQEKTAVVRDLLLKLSIENNIEALEQTLAKTGRPGDMAGERIIHIDSDLSLVCESRPPKYQSGMFDHAAFCVSVTIKGVERSICYIQQVEDGRLEPLHPQDVAAGEVLEFAPNTIRAVENPSTEEENLVLLCYLGDIRELSKNRHVWDSKTHKPLPYSREEVVRQGVTRMMAPLEHGAGVMNAVGGTAVSTTNSQ